jgi:hypothetical protein
VRIIDNAIAYPLPARRPAHSTRSAGIPQKQAGKGNSKMNASVTEQPKVTISAIKYCADGRVINYGVVTGGSILDRIKNKIIAITGRRA